MKVTHTGGRAPKYTKDEWLAIKHFSEWKLNRVGRTTTLLNVLRKYCQGMVLSPKEFNFLDFRAEKAGTSERRYFRPQQVLSTFRKMTAKQVENIFTRVNQLNALRRKGL